jgi:uncharacterized protein
MTLQHGVQVNPVLQCEGHHPTPLAVHLLSFTQPTHLLVMLALTALAAGLSRGFSGFGAALIFIPVAARLVGPQLASAMLPVIDGVLAAPLIKPAWSVASRPAVSMMVLGALVGIPLGTVVLALADPLVLRWLIEGLAVAMLLLLLSGWRYHGKPHGALTVAVGMLSGLFSGIAQIGGPPVVAYWLGGETRADATRASIILFFAAGNIIGIASYWAGGLMTREVFLLALVSAPGYGLGLWLGTKLFGHASETTFRGVALGLIAFAIILGLPLWG